MWNRGNVTRTGSSSTNSHIQEKKTCQELKVLSAESVSYSSLFKNISIMPQMCGFSKFEVVSNQVNKLMQGNELCTHQSCLIRGFES